MYNHSTINNLIRLSVRTRPLPSGTLYPPDPLECGVVGRPLSARVILVSPPLPLRIRPSLRIILRVINEWDLNWTVLHRWTTIPPVSSLRILYPSGLFTLNWWYGRRTSPSLLVTTVSFLNLGRGRTCTCRQHSRSGCSDHPLDPPLFRLWILSSPIWFVSFFHLQILSPPLKNCRLHYFWVTSWAFDNLVR